MDYVQFELYDPKTQESFIIELNAANAEKVQKDMLNVSNTCASTTNPLQIESHDLLPSTCASDSVSIKRLEIEMDDDDFSPNEETFLYNEDPDDIIPPDDSVSDDTVPPDYIVPDEEFVQTFRWSHEAILLLLEEYRQREQDMYSGRISNKKAWEQIASVLNNKGYIVTARQCTTRVNTMKRTYKSVKDHNKKSGNYNRQWKYFNLMETLLGDKPNMVPLSTISSTGTETVTTKTESCTLPSSSSSIPGKSYMNISVSRKRKANDIQVLQTQKYAEEGKERRHREKIEIKEKLLEKLDKLIDKL